MRPLRRSTTIWLSVLVSALLVACGDNGSSTSPTVSDTTDLSAAERCEANRDAGKITFISSFDFAASATILDVVVADAEGYFEELCLDVDIKPDFAPRNGGLVAAGKGQISSAGSFSEMVNTNVQGEANLVAIAQYGKTAIETLVVPADSEIVELGDLSGATIGIKGDLPYSLQAMLALAGVERSSLTERLLEGYDPVAHLDLGIDALPVYKSNEPAQLDAAGVEYRQFDPLDFDVPSSFGVFFTSETFLADHPTAVEDFLRAAFRGFEFSVQNPDVAVGHAFERINAAGNPNYLATQGESFRWTTEAKLVLDTTAEGEGLGLLNIDGLEAEIKLMTDVGVFDSEPDWRSMIAPGLAEGIYDGITIVSID